MYIETPPQLDNLHAVYSYLFRLSEMLNVALEQVPAEAAAKAVVAVSGESTPMQKAAESLRELILNTATIVRKEMDSVSTELHSQYTAISEQFGTYEQTLTGTITATAEGILQQYQFADRIDALDAETAGFERYQKETQGFIRQGFIGYKPDGTPELGIAIGQNLQSHTVVIEGEPLEQLDATQSCAFYTSDRVSFRLGGNEVAYFSRAKLHIGDADISGTLTLGDWQISHDSAGLTFKWIGG